MKISKALFAILLLLPVVAHAWWNKDWKERTQIILNTSAAGVSTKDAISGLVIPVRLHSGNFDFASAKPDGSDLRLVAGDDKTPLKFHIERYDSANELAVVWVQVPNILPGTDKNQIFAYAGNQAAPPQADDGAEVYDSNTVAVLHFADKDGIASDQTGTIKATAPTTVEPNGLIGSSARFSGTALSFPAGTSIKAPASGPLTLSFWIKPDTAQGTLYAQGPLKVALDNGALSATLGKFKLDGGAIAPANWSNVVLTLGSGKLALYVNGARTGQGDVPADQAAPIEGEIALGDGYQGLFDELQFAAVERSADWIGLAYASQGADPKLVATQTQTPDTVDSGESGPNYFGILFKALTPDGMAVIAILGVMFAISVWVMLDKAMLVRRVEAANDAFMDRFGEAQDLLSLAGKPSTPSNSRAVARRQSTPAVETVNEFPNSPIYRLYRAGARELRKREVGHGEKFLSGAALDAVKAAVDAQVVRENQRLNGKMVLLTIAIAGGPFLGLLGTVVGVMITFAAIAAAGDVNVNAIAPGIAGALLATVAGLGVAIPSLFGYNYLASRIKVVSADMQIFVDEFVTRAAELYGAG